MKLRPLGNSGIEIAPLALGGNVFGFTADELTSFAILDRAVEAGINLIDTADIYSRWVPGHKGGESETVIGRWLARGGRRDRIVLATKVGGDMGDGRKGLTRDYIVRAVEASLARLQTDHIDLYQSHYDDPATPIVETLEAYGQLIRQGKVRAVGASNYSADRLAEALGTSRQGGLPRYESLQPHYNLLERADFEQNLAPLCLREGIGVIAYFGLARGFLTGKYRSKDDLKKSVRGDTVEPYLNDRGLRVLAALDDVAGRLRATPAQVSLAWLMSQPAVTAPIASATSIDQLEDLIAAMHLELDQPALDRLDAASRQ